MKYLIFGNYDGNETVIQYEKTRVVRERPEFLFVAEAFEKPRILRDVKGILREENGKIFMYNQDEEFTLPDDVISEAVTSMLQDQKQVDRLAEQVEDKKVIEQIKSEIKISSKKISSEKFKALA